MCLRLAKQGEPRDLIDHVRDITTADITKRGEDKKSMIPEGLVANLAPEELAGILAYFEQLAK